MARQSLPDSPIFALCFSSLLRFCACSSRAKRFSAEPRDPLLHLFFPHPSTNRGCPTLATSLFLSLGWDRASAPGLAFAFAFSPHPKRSVIPSEAPFSGAEGPAFALVLFSPNHKRRVPHPRDVFVFVARVGGAERLRSCLCFLSSLAFPNKVSSRAAQLAVRVRSRDRSPIRR